ncbi:MAG TPA: YlxR family protein [Actinomycetota bacterium]
MAPGAEPERTCVGCREKAGKRGLLRVVRSPDGVVRVDAVGKAPGRGAYVHRDTSCLEAALRRGALARALRTGLGPDEAARLRIAIEREVVR